MLMTVISNHFLTRCLITHLSLYRTIILYHVLLTTLTKVITIFITHSTMTIHKHSNHMQFKIVHYHIPVSCCPIESITYLLISKIIRGVIRCICYLYERNLLTISFDLDTNFAIRLKLYPLHFHKSTIESKKEILFNQLMYWIKCFMKIPKMLNISLNA